MFIQYHVLRSQISQRYLPWFTYHFKLPYMSFRPVFATSDVQIGAGYMILRRPLTFDIHE